MFVLGHTYQKPGVLGILTHPSSGLIINQLRHACNKQCKLSLLYWATDKVFVGWYQWTFWCIDVVPNPLIVSNLLPFDRICCTVGAMKLVYGTFTTYKSKQVITVVMLLSCVQ